MLGSNYKNIQEKNKNLKEKIPTDILSFVDDSLLISQEKSYDLFPSSFFVATISCQKFSWILAWSWNTANPKFSTS